MAKSPPDAEYSHASLRSLKLRAGMFLQAQGVKEGSFDCEAQFLGMIEGKCLMIVPVGLVGVKFGMQTGQTYVIRGFTGQYDFRFTSTVIQAFDFTFRTPAYAYAVLSFPEEVEARKVRNAMRIKTTLPARATPHGSETPLMVTVVDLSIDGALVSSPSALGTTGDLVRLDFSIASDIASAPLLTLARICHSNEDGGEAGVLTGLLFESISAANRVSLKDFVLSNLE